MSGQNPHPGDMHHGQIPVGCNYENGMPKVARNAFSLCEVRL